MLINLFKTLKEVGVPCTLRELLDLISGLEKQVIFADINDFYYLSRSVLVKDEKHYDKFDRAFDIYFKGLETLDDVLQALVPEEWLRKEFEKFLTEDELKKIETMGGLEKLLSEFKKRLEEQKGKHQKGDKWVGTGGTSPFGNAGSHPEGIRVDGEGKQNKAVKVWQQRDYKNLDDSVELGTRNIKVALRRLRRFAREGAETELDLDNTIKSTAHKGYIDVKMMPERRNKIKVLLFFDVGGSMDAHVKICEELFSAARTEFKHMEYFYFHNCLYDTVWKDNARRYNEHIQTWDLLHTYPSDYKVIFVGDAEMSPYEITYPGGSVEYWNEESGETWINRMLNIYENAIWLNPIPQRYWDRITSASIMKQLFSDRMFPLTIEGIDQAMRELNK